jgi:hypothetical protein
MGSDQRYLSDKIMPLYLFPKNKTFWKDGNGHERTFRYKQGNQTKKYLLLPLMQNPNEQYTFAIHLRPTFCIHILQKKSKFQQLIIVGLILPDEMADWYLE